MLTVMYFFWDGFSAPTVASTSGRFYRPGALDYSSSRPAAVDYASDRPARVDQASEHRGTSDEQVQ